MLRPHVAGEIVVGDIGPVVGTHAGRGTIGVAFQVTTPTSRHSLRRIARDCPTQRRRTTSVRAADMPQQRPQAPPHSPTGRLLAQRYQLERRTRARRHGRGLAGRPTSTLDRKVAVKLLKPTLATDPVVAERFRREAIAVAQPEPPEHRRRPRRDRTSDGRQAVVMQLVDGKSLRQLLDEQKRLSPELTIHIGSCVARRPRRTRTAPASCTATSSPATS